MANPIRRNNPPAPGPRPAPARKPFPLSTTRSGRGGERALYIGPPLTGKTTYMITWPGLVVLQFDDERTTLDELAPGIPVVEVRNWAEWQQLILPKLRSRALFTQEIQEKHPGYGIQTIAVDSYTGLDEKCEAYWREQGFKDNRQMYGAKLDNLCGTQGTLMDLTRPDPQGNRWNLVGCAHEDVRMTQDDDGKGQITEVRAAITGKFGQNFFKSWGTILWCFKQTHTAANGSLIRGTAPSYFCRTDTIDRWRSGVDRKNKLPSKVGGSYEELMSYWRPEKETT